MSRIKSLLRTTAVRLSALYVILFGLVAVGLSIYMTSLTVSMLTDQTEQTLNEEVINIERAYQHGGLPLLVRTIDRRSRQPGAFLYLIADPQGRFLAGNVASIEAGLLTNSGLLHNSVVYSRFGDSGEKIEHRAIVTVIDLPNGMKLLVGRDIGEPEKFITIIRKALMIAFAAMAAGALLIWFFVGRRALRRIDQVTAASQRLMAGDLTGRLPVSGAGDEFDRLSANLNVMLERIEELNNGLRQVSDNIAHDLKTPLTRLRNRADEALLRRSKTADYRQTLEAIIAESDQLIRTFNAILMISRIEASTSVEHLEKLDARPIVEDVGELYGPVAEEAGVKFEMGKTFDVDLFLNRELLAQALINLIDNAIKYGATSQTEPKISLSMEDNGDHVAVVVSDNGPGIAATDRERVTKRFVRLEDSRTKPGFGIGLSLAKAVMKLHGGELILEDANPGLKAILLFPKLPKQSRPIEH
ncbi:HAMP domain-containing sensor histidine kinase [uncultured Bartonella sp.]|uniref:sensor histidine kinase n=1 Tax=uncultured Bartonella sp. TaxID=104108 RepID=UPI00261DC5A0|nr:HAMP domain-containing sensor histidine kinase [uncultured Bartonella sp.]